jgi:sRNA-binding protein
MSVYTTREERDRAVRILAQEFPKTFFTIARQRKPLKHGTEKDIEAALAEDNDHPLLDVDIPDAVAWYRSHVSYAKACSVAGVSRIDLAGEPVSKVTASEAREAEAEAAEAFSEIEARRRAAGNGLPAFVAPSPAPPKVSAIQVNATLSTDELLVELEKQVELVRTVLAADPDDLLRKQLARSALVLMADEVRTIIARLDQS